MFVVLIFSFNPKLTEVEITTCFNTTATHSPQKLPYSWQATRYLNTFRIFPLKFLIRKYIYLYIQFICSGTHLIQTPKCALLSGCPYLAGTRNKCLDIFYRYNFKNFKKAIVWFQKISIPTPRKVIGNSEGEGDLKSQNF